ncbi:MAG: Sec-independent protein translocase protein TatA [Desulfovibrio sp.]
MPHLGMSEIVVILVVFVALFGYKKLPDLGRNLGKGLKNFKRSVAEPDEIDITPKTDGTKEEGAAHKPGGTGGSGGSGEGKGTNT